MLTALNLTVLRITQTGARERTVLIPEEKYCYFFTLEAAGAKNFDQQ
jgi:hypothetical protein